MYRDVAVLGRGFVKLPAHEAVELASLLAPELLSRDKTHSYARQKITEGPQRV